MNQIFLQINLDAQRNIFLSQREKLVSSEPKKDDRDFLF